MKLAVAAWGNRISPVLDVSHQVLLLEVVGGKVLARERRELPGGGAAERAEWLGALGVEELICGAVSRPLAEMIAARGIRLVAFVAGETEKVVAAHLAGDLPKPSLTMPGCCGRRWRFGGGRGRGCRRGRERR
jgi:predicted Fe-Mo cluster-binding NifX family protein